MSFGMIYRGLCHCQTCHNYQKPAGLHICHGKILRSSLNHKDETSKYFMMNVGITKLESFDVSLMGFGQWFIIDLKDFEWCSASFPFLEKKIQIYQYIIIVATQFFWGPLANCSCLSTWHSFEATLRIHEYLVWKKMPMKS